MAGYAGTQHRATYTCIGDKVNLASRLEGHTKRVSHPILMDDATRSAAGETLSCIDIGQVTFEGISNAVAVFAVGGS